MPNPFRRQHPPRPRMEREDEAALMLPHTRFGKGVAVFLAGAFLGSIFLAAIARGLPLIQAGEQKSASSKPAGAGLGAAPQAASSDPMDAARPYTQGILSKYLKGRNAQVIVGEKGWLFYDLGLKFITGPSFLDAKLLKNAEARGLYPDPRPAMLEMRDSLRKRGIQLMLLPVPEKASIYPEKVWPAYTAGGPAPVNLAFEKWKQEMHAAGIALYDPTELFQMARLNSPHLLYVPTDSHWTPYGAQVCGQGLAGWVKTSLGEGIVGNADLRAYHSTARAPRDLVNLLGIANDQNEYHPDPVPLRGIRQAGGYLKPNPNAEILLIGDSLCGVYDQTGASLGAHLAYELKTNVDWLSISNGGSWRSRFALRDALAKGQDPLAHKKLVIWEFTVRDLTSGDWKPCPLGLPTAPTAVAVPSAVPSPAKSASGPV